MTDIDRGRNPAIPVYRQIANWYADRIREAVYQPGQQLETVAEMCARWKIASKTAQAVRDALVDDGLVETSRRGTFVRRVPQIHRRAVARYAQQAREYAGGRGAFDGEIRAHGMVPRSDVTVTQEVPPSRVAEILQVAPGERSVIVRRRKMYADNVPVQLAPSYIPADIAAGTTLEQVDTGPGGMLSRLADLGYAEVHMSESVRIRRATAEERRFLQLVGDAPVIEIFHVGRTEGGRAVEVCVHSVPAYGWILDYEWRADQP